LRDNQQKRENEQLELTNELEINKQVLENKVEKRTEDLQKKLNELERFRQATIDREFRMEELREKIKILETKINP